VLAARPFIGGLPKNVARLPFEQPPARRDAWRDLLAAACDMLDCPPPADPAAEGVFLRLRCERAQLMLGVLRSVLADPVPGPVQLTEAAGRLRSGMAGCPADGYVHSPLSF
jgi:hypothetical protein